MIIFNLYASDELFQGLCEALSAKAGMLSRRDFPDGETYLKVDQSVEQADIFILASLDNPNKKILPLLFLTDTLKELGAKSVNLIAPYLGYMRQDTRFNPGEAVTSRTFAKVISQYFDSLITVDPHLHRYYSLSEIYTIPAVALSAEVLLAKQLTQYENHAVLVGPDAESEQWLQRLSEYSGLPYVVGQKQRLGDRAVKIQLPDLQAYQGRVAVMVDDVISSGQTLLECLALLQQRGFIDIDCLAVHGIFVDQVDVKLQQQGLRRLITSNSIAHVSNKVDLTPLLAEAVLQLRG